MKPLNRDTGYFRVLESFPQEGWHTTDVLVEEGAPFEDRLREGLQPFLIDLCERGALENRKRQGVNTEYKMTERGRKALK